MDYRRLNLDGITINPKNVASAMDQQRPTTLIEVRSFLGLAEHYPQFVKNFSTIAKPMTMLTMKGTPFVGLMIVRRAFILWRRSW